VGGALYCLNSSPIVTNCILWGNLPDEIYVFGGSPIVSYSDVQGGWPGQGNIDESPLFTSGMGFDYLLLPQSPCIDTGDPALEDRLYDKHPRWPDWYPDGARSDIGAYGGPGNSWWFK